MGKKKKKSVLSPSFEEEQEEEDEEELVDFEPEDQTEQEMEESSPPLEVQGAGAGAAAAASRGAGDVMSVTSGDDPLVPEDPLELIKANFNEEMAARVLAMRQNMVPRPLSATSEAYALMQLNAVTPPLKPSPALPQPNRTKQSSARNKGTPAAPRMTVTFGTGNSGGGSGGNRSGGHHSASNPFDGPDCDHPTCKSHHTHDLPHCFTRKREVREAKAEKKSGRRNTKQKRPRRGRDVRNSDSEE